MKWYDLDPEELQRQLASIARLRASVERATWSLPEFGDATASSEEWPDELLEDILDAEYIIEE